MSTARPKKPGPMAGLRPRLRMAHPSGVGRGNQEPEWVAWSNDLSRIVARGATLEQARDAARALGEEEPALEPVQSRARLA